MDKTSNRQEDLKKLLKITENIMKKYAQLANLEQMGLKNSEIFIGICKSISVDKEKACALITKYPTSDTFTQDLYENAYPQGNEYVDAFDFCKYLKNNPADRIFEYMDEYEIINGTYSLVDGKEYNDIFEKICYYDQKKDKVRVVEKPLKHPTDKERDDLDYVINKIVTFVFMSYLDEALMHVKEEKYVKELIKLKYNIISNLSFLEDDFLLGLSFKDALNRCYEEYYQLLEKYDVYHPITIEHHMEIIEDLQDLIKAREKEDFEDDEDYIIDIIIGLMLKTHITCIPDKDIRETVINDEKIDANYTKTYIDNILLTKSADINNSYVRNFRS